jgi:hypothetical protein
MYPQPWVYFARAVDLLDPSAVASAAAGVGRLLERHRMRLIDPLEHEAAAALPGLPADVRSAALVELDLALLRRSDAMLVDMTIPDRNYIGCVAELVYARTWRIPAVVYVGSTGYGERPWLRYHATHICHGLDEAIELLQRSLLSGAVAQLPARTAIRPAAEDPAPDRAPG